MSLVFPTVSVDGNQTMINNHMVMFRFIREGEVDNIVDGCHRLHAIHSLPYVYLMVHWTNTLSPYTFMLAMQHHLLSPEIFRGQ